MRNFLRRRWDDATGGKIGERLDEVSADLPYELQSKLFDQLATVSVAGAGLTVTLIGSLLQDAHPSVWLAVVLFTIGGLFAVHGNMTLIGGLFRKRPVLRRSNIDLSVTLGLIGMAIGVLSMHVYAGGAPS